MQIQYN